MDEKVDVDKPFESLMQHILKIDEIAQLQPEQIESEASIRKPLYSKRIVQNLTLDSIIFRNALTYAVIMGAAIFVSLFFNIQRSYWIPLSAHTVLLGLTTIRMLDRSLALGTIVGTLLLYILFPTSFNCRSHFNGAVCYDDRRICRSKLCFCSYFYYNTSHPVKWFSLW